MPRRTRRPPVPPYTPPECGTTSVAAVGASLAGLSAARSLRKQGYDGPLVRRRADSAMLPLVARAGVPYVAMHWRGHADGMQANAGYDDVAAGVADELRLRVEAALHAGIAPDRLVLDPGLGFAKTPEHKRQLLGRLREVTAPGYPVLVGAARKSFLGELPADPATGLARPPQQRDAATSAVTVLAATQGAWCVRVHDVASTADAVRVTARRGLEA
ncbi:dihydropteroate synthase [Streptomyces sp. NPDC053560]|uniref:dihydropteroate synthase n=1 Tax=Streptomyces sp. NPDC053560 TaxID=3365711 RepID=UPI0037D29C24